MAARATFALKAGVWFRRGRLVIVSPFPQPSRPLSGRNSTQRLCPDSPSQLSSRQLYNAAHVALALGLGRPGIFRPRYAEAWRPGEVALHDHAPLRGTLERLVDFELLNRAGPRLSVGCVDVESGEEVWFDSAEEPIRPEHVLASAALMPHLPPVAIGGRLLCDPGYVNNLPVDRALAEPPERDLLCLAVDLFCLRGGRPASLGAAVGRMEDVLFASHAARHVAALRREYELRARLEPGGPSVRVVHLAYRAPGHEVAARMFDFSPASIGDRWAAGRPDMPRAPAPASSGVGPACRFAYVAAASGDATGGGDGPVPSPGP